MSLQKLPKNWLHLRSLKQRSQNYLQHLRSCLLQSLRSLLLKLSLTLLEQRSLQQSQKNLPLLQM